VTATAIVSHLLPFHFNTQFLPLHFLLTTHLLSWKQLTSLAYSFMWAGRVWVCLQKLSLNVCIWLGSKVMFSYEHTLYPKKWHPVFVVNKALLALGWLCHNTIKDSHQGWPVMVTVAHMIIYHHIFADYWMLYAGLHDFLITLNNFSVGVQILNRR
jgi:hypothetical protein